MLHGDQLAELLAYIAEAPDVTTASAYLLAELAEVSGAGRGSVFLIEGDRLTLVASTPHASLVAPSGEASITLEHPSHPLVVSALSLQPVSFEAHPDAPVGDGAPMWVALPFAQPQTRGAPQLRRDPIGRELPPGYTMHAAMEGRVRRVGRAPAGLVVLETPMSPGMIEALDRVVTMAGAVLSRIAIGESVRRSADRLETQSELLNSILDALPDPIVITDAVNDIVVQNRQAEHLLLARDADSGGRRRAVEINNLLFTSFLTKSVMTGGATSGARELNLVDPDEGTDLLFEVIGHPLDSPSRSGQFLAVLRNVTDLRRAVNELERQIQRVRLAEIEATRERDRLNLILENVADPILVTDDRSNIILLNEQAERLFALRDEGAVDNRSSLAVRENDTKFTTFISDFGIDSATGTRAQMRLIDPASGREVPMEVVSGKISERGQTVAIVSVLHDLTKQEENQRLYEALKRLNSELEQRIGEATADLAEQNARLQWQSQEVAKANKLKSDFLATMSHELRTPINALIGYSALLLDRIYGELTSQQEEGLKRIRASANHLLELINDILDLAKIEAGKMPINLESVSVAEVVAEVSSQIEPMVRSKGLVYEADVPPELPPLVTDRTKVKQILLNLLANAVKFTSRGAVRLVMRVDRGEAKGITISVTDTGIGIQPKDLEAIWEDFRQLDQSRTREYGGTGLGLSITRKLATQLGGRVWVESAYGQGSTFSVFLPFSSVREAEAESRIGVTGPGALAAAGD